MQRIRQWRPSPRVLYWVILPLGALLLFAFLVWLSLHVAWPTWTGFDQHPVPDGVATEKTLWDWMELFLLPLALAGAATGFSRVEKATGRDFANDKQREDALRSYLDKMSDRLLRDMLRTSVDSAEVRQVARARTLTVLQRLDATWKAAVLQFLFESKRMLENKSVINLSGANLVGADLVEPTSRRPTLNELASKAHASPLSNCARRAIEGIVTDLVLDSNPCAPASHAPSRPQRCLARPR